MIRLQCLQKQKLPSRWQSKTNNKISNKKYYLLKGKDLTKGDHQKTNTINNSGKAKEAPLKSEKQRKINMISVTIIYTLYRKARKRWKINK